LSTICAIIISPGIAVAQCLRCCATNRIVAGSIPDGISGIFTDIKYFRSNYGTGVDSASNIYARIVAGSIPDGISGIFTEIKYFRSNYGTGVDSASNIYEYQEHFLGVQAAGA